MHEYTKEFYSLINRTEAAEDDDKLVVRCLLGLHVDLQERLYRFYFTNVAEIIPKAEYFEGHLNKASFRPLPPSQGFWPQLVGGVSNAGSKPQ